MFRPACSQHRYIPNLVQPPHAHPEGSVTLIVAGEFLEETAEGARRVSAGSILVKSAGVEHGDAFGRLLTTALTVRFPAAIALPRYGVYDDARLIATAVRVHCFNADPVDLAGALQRTALPINSELIIDAERLIGRMLPARIAVASLARALSVHPVSLARRFRQAHGCSVQYFIRRARTRYALQLLASTHLELAGVASAAGFADQSHMHRSVVDHTSLTPAAYRRLATRLAV